MGDDHELRNWHATHGARANPFHAGSQHAPSGQPKPKPTLDPLAGLTQAQAAAMDPMDIIQKLRDSQAQNRDEDDEDGGVAESIVSILLGEAEL